MPVSTKLTDIYPIRLDNILKWGNRIIGSDM